MNGLVDLNNKSLSQPATPPRSSPNTTIDHSQSLPNSILRGSRRTSIYNIPLPPHGLSEATTFLSQQLQHQLSERGRSRSRHSTHNTTSNHGSVTPKLRRSVTPNSRMSLTPIRSRRNSRRRSSIIITKTGEKLYEPNYQGPITIDYLKFFCKTLIQNQDKINQQQQQQRQQQLGNHLLILVIWLHLKKETIVGFQKQVNTLLKKAQMSYHRSRRMNQTHHYRYKKSLVNL